MAGQEKRQGQGKEKSGMNSGNAAINAGGAGGSSEKREARSDVFKNIPGNQTPNTPNVKESERNQKK